MEMWRIDLRLGCVRYTGADKNAFLLLTEAQLYALRNPRFGKKLRTLFGMIQDNLTTSVEHLLEQMGYKDSALAQKLAFIGFAFSYGMTFYSLMDPERYSDRLASESTRFVFDRIFPKAG
jgi:hypothetical protein